ncbi:MAG: hypothetical protein WED10_09155 [Brumimicrobium sp.]
MSQNKDINRKLSHTPSLLEQALENQRKIEDAVVSPIHREMQSQSRLKDDIISPLWSAMQNSRELMDAATSPYDRFSENYNKESEKLQHFRNSKDILSDIFEPSKYAEQIFGKYRDSNIFEEINETRIRTAKYLKRLNKETPNILKDLAGYGWYLDFGTDVGLPLELGAKLKDEKIEEVDSYLVNYYSNALDKIFNTLQEKHSKRKSIFKQILQSHKSGNYFLSIPAMFSQIDGICMDMTKKKFFMKNKNKKDEYQHKSELIHALGNDFSEILKAFLYPIYCDTPAIAHVSILHEFPVQLNRHAIMHGEDTEYGSEVNSLKCISLLKYISDMLVNVFEERDLKT